MTIRLYDTATRSVRDFVPVEPGKASLYLCGATVQGSPHIGHVRSGVNFDVLSRWLGMESAAIDALREDGVIGAEPPAAEFKGAAGAH